MKRSRVLALVILALVVAIVAMVVVGVKYAQKERPSIAEPTPQLDEDEWWYRVGRPGSYGYIDTSGRKVTSLKYEDCEPTSKTLLFWFRRGDKIGFMHRSGKTKIPPRFTRALPFRNGLAPCSTERRFGYVNTDGVFVLPPQWDIAYVFRNGVAKVGKRDYWAAKLGTVLVHYSYIDTMGDSVDEFDPRVAQYDPYDRGIRIVREKKLIGFVRDDGTIIFPPQFLSAMGFANGLCAVRRGRSWGYIDDRGNDAIPFVFDYARSFFGPLAKVKLKGVRCYIDRSGAVVWREL